MRTIVITGTRKGIGKAIAEHYIAAGFEVIGCSRGNASIKHANYQHFSLDV
ncbi:MAG: SDR family NAD(P)-dependent oxidoreductase, partial [Verrucomicrobiota bacterium]|nr:SDR family NAD(P)-dependent oxidoreductase [Verrucomicrobiota bacterium]